MEKKIVINKHYSVLRNAEITADKVLAKVQEEKFSLAKAEDLKKITQDLKKRLLKKDDLDSIMVEAFAAAYKAVDLVYGIKLYKVQIMGGYALHKGDVAEMKTGEGKTLTAILPAYLNALSGKSVHIITVNEYLSSRDALNTGRVFTLLGLTTGSIKSDMEPEDKKIEYRKNIVYMTNSELGFDYLRDNLVQDINEKTQTGLKYAIVDEVDSVLIDEARTPLIISGGSAVSEEEYIRVDDLVLKLGEGDYDIDKESKQAFLTKQGADFIEKETGIVNLYSFSNSEFVHRIHNALQAHNIYKLDVDYTVRDDEIVLIDIFTGRFLEGRQYSNGLNQALEAKERIKIKPETRVYASITYQNLFRMYDKLSGMSGTAVPEEEELSAIYNMRVIPIPTNRPMIRKDKPDVIFATSKAKFKALIKKIIEIHKKGIPILVGTRSVQDSENVSAELNKLNIKHEVLNAKNHAREADIIENAGKMNSITISTNMAGRGTDIKLGEGVTELGGLFVLGSERHESRRIDDQLRGRSGRQGDVGESQFYVSLDDEIMVRAGLKKIQKFAGSLDDTPIESKMIAKSITNSQKKLEGLNYDSRKYIVEYDDVLNQQRLITYKQRDSVLTSNDLNSIVKKMIEGFVKYIAEEAQAYDGNKFNSINLIKGMKMNIPDLEVTEQKISKDEAIEYLTIKLKEHYDKKFNKEEDEEFSERLRSILIYSIDSSWQEQIERLNRLKTGIRYRQYAQKNPVQAYVLESDKLFNFFKNEIIEKTILILFKNSVEEREIKELIREEEREVHKDILIK